MSVVRVHNTALQRLVSVENVPSIVEAQIALDQDGGVAIGTSEDQTVRIKPADGNRGSVTVGRVTGLERTRIVADDDAVSVAYHREQSLYKAPVHACATAPVVLATITPGSVLDDVTLLAGDRVLLLAQAAPPENGIYVVAAAGPPVRAPDLPAGSSAHGVCVYVRENPKPVAASRNAGRFFVGTAPPSALVDAADVTFERAEAVAGRGAGAPLRARAAVLDVDVNLATDLVVGQVLDATVVLGTGDRVLLTAQANPVENGLYVVPAVDAGSPAARAPEMPANGITDVAGALVFVAHGSVAGGRLFCCGNAGGAGTVGTDALQFAPVAQPPTKLAGIGLQTDVPQRRLGVDFAVVPGLPLTNTFTGPSNTFQNAVVVAGAAPATSQATGALVVAGGVGVGGDVFCASTYNMSDATLKEEVAPIDRPAEILNRLRGYTFRWNDHAENAQHGRVGETSVGCLAQEVRAAGPAAARCVHEDPATGLLAVDYAKLVPVLIEGVRDLMRRCDALETELGALRGGPRP